MTGTPAHAKRLPLTSAQREIWLDQLRHGDAPVYKIGGYVRIDGLVDASLFERAVNLLIEKHDALRTVLAPADDPDETPKQAIAASLAVRVPLRDFSTADDPHATALAYARQQLAQPFPLNGSDPFFRFELLKLNDTLYFFTLDFHHLIVDGWAIALLVDSLCGLYTALSGGSAPAMIAPSYEEFVAHDQAYRESPAFERQRAYWVEKYRSAPDPLFPPRYQERYGRGSSPSGHHALRMPRGFFERVARFARQRESTPFHVVLALLHVYYARTRNRDEIVVGVPILNRPNARVKQMAGMCAGVAAVRLPFDERSSFDALLHTIGRTLKQDYRHQRFPLSELNRELGLLKAQRAQLFDLSVSYERDDYDLRMGEGRARIFMLSSGYEQMPLMLHIRENPFDDEAWIHFMYNRAWFDDTEIEATAQRLLILLDQVLDDSARPVGQLTLTTPSERQILARWGQAKTVFESDETIHGRFEQVAARTPDAIALTFDHRSLTYGQLNARANRLARRLMNIGVRADDRVAICAVRGIEMVVGLLAILKAGGAYVPLDPAYPAERLAWMLEDCAPVAVLVQAGQEACIEPAAAPILSFDSEEQADGLDHEALNVRPDDSGPERLAYVIYTSGSTGRPKGVMIEHRNVMRLFAATDAWFRFGGQDVWALFHSFAFDFSVWEIWGALLHGGRLVIVPYLTSRSPRECYALLCAEGVTVLNQTPSAFRQLIAAQGEADAQPHRLRTVIFGGEALELSILTPWFERAVNADVQLVNMYGITETTVHVSYRPIRASDVADRVHASVNSVGEPIPDLSVYVLDARMQPAPIGVEGELYVGGAGVARGYLNRPELTQGRFVRDPFSGDDAARLYRSGDVGRWLPGGALEYLGRNDEQVKVRGFRIELGEIEAALAEADGIVEAVVVAREDGQGDKRLVAYYVGEPREAATLRAHLLARMPEYMAPSAYVRLDRFPLTPNGKLDRRALPAPGRQEQEGRAYEAPRGIVETQLARIWAEVLGVERVGRHDHFFELGGHSLLAVKVIERMRRLGMQADVKVLFSQPTLEALGAAAAGSTPPADAPENRIAEGCARITPDMLPLVTLDQAAIDRIVAQAPGGVGNIQDIYPLAPLQQGILYHHVSASEGDPYVMQVLLGIDSRARLDALIGALQTVVERHDVFRTIVLWEGLDEPVQVVLRQARLHTQEVALDTRNDDVAAQMQARFDPRYVRLDLKRAPLMRIAYARARDDDQWVAVLLFHHLVDDATSLRLLRREVARIMRGDGHRLPEQLAYRRYVAQTRANRSDSSEEGHEAFFREMLGDVTEPTLPYGIADVHGDGRGVKEAKHDLSPALSARIRRRAQHLGVSVATLYHLAWARVVGGLSGREDVVFGTVLMGRLLSGGDVDRAMGMFINTLPVRIDVGALSVRDAVIATHRRLSALLSHEHATLVLAQRCSGVAAPLPLFSALLNFRHSDAHAQLPGAQLDWDGIEILDFVERTNYPLMLAVADTGQAFSLTVQAIDRIDAGRVSQYVAHAMERIVDALEQAPHESMNALTFVPAAERHEVLEAFNATAVAYPAGETVHGLFERQAARTPEVVALTYEGTSYRYGELDARAVALARRLVELGVSPDTRVAICVERSPEMVIGLLAILKAGGAYVPLDPGYPVDRLRYMLADSAPVALLVHEATAGLFDGDDLGSVQSIDIGPFADAPAVPHAFASPGSISPRAEPSHLAYVIYTSGSTGRPKGVMNEHHAVVNRLRWMRDALALAEQDVILQKTPFSFDVSVWEFFLPLMMGARLVLARPAGHKDPAYLSELIERERVTTAHFVPSMLQVFVDHARPSQCASLKRVVCSGEALPGHLLRRFNGAFGASTLYNLYGPTEAAVDVTAWASPGAALDVATDNPPIGKPIANTRIYILDSKGRPAPIGVPGEIHIGGVQVARGYLNRPALTAEKFIDDPFSSAPAARMYRTGDLGRWLPNGNVEYLGRNDDQIKLRGFRVELGEIEAKLSEVDGVREAVVVAREHEPGNMRLVAYITGDAVDIDALRRHAATQLPDYMAPAAYVALATLPQTPNGKLDRKALPAPDRTAYSRGRYETPREGTEQTLAAIWGSLLDVERVGRHDNFFELGGHSLLMMGLIERMRRVGLHADIRLLFSAPTLAELAARVERGDGPMAAPPNLIPAGAQRITPRMLTLVSLGQHAIDTIVSTVRGGAENVQDIYPLAPLQQGILYHHLSTARGDPYVLHGMFGFASRDRVDGFLAALARVIARHDALRTSIVWEGLDEPVQVVWREAALEVEEVTLDTAEGEAAAALRTRFDTRRTRLDLRRPPLMRFVVAYDAGGNRWLGMLLFHHLALDHAALEIVRREVQAYLLDADAALPEPIPYRDHVARSRLGTSQAAHEAFFSDMLRDIDAPTLPYGRGEVQGDGGTVHEYTEPVPTSLGARLIAHARALDVSAAGVLHTVWGAVLSALTGGREDVVFGTVLLGRFERAEEASRTVGLFINTLPVRVSIGGLDVPTTIKATAARLAALLQHEHASLALAQRCSGVPAPAPLFGALLNYRHSDTAMAAKGVRETWRGVEMIGAHERTNYPLVLSVDDFGGEFSMTVQAIDGIDAQRVAGYVLQGLESVIDALEHAPHTLMHSLTILPARERRQLLETFNATAVAYPAGDTVHELFERQAARTPDAIAVAQGDEQYSYRELDLRADALAHRLVELGAAPDTRVAVCVERSYDMIVGLLAVLKAGAAYVPLDPSYPPERLRYMLGDSAPVALLIHEGTSTLFDGASPPTIDVGERQPDRGRPPVARAQAEHLAYVIYTSGSTGQPKGVMVEHRHLVNLVRWHCDAFSLAPSHRTTAMAGVGFDAAAWEIWPTLCSGASLLLPPASAALDPQRMLAWWHAQKVDVGFLVTPLAELAYASERANAHARTVLIGGDRLTRWPAGIGRDQALVNNYGPTEGTVVATSGALHADDTTLHIGRPIANVRIYILDGRGQPAPVGVPGEIHIGGAQVARGYLNRPQLTADKFVRDPFDSNSSSRMYRTGDLGRWLPDGNIEYLGRNDDQAKIRGVRIEPMEIEAVLSNVDGVRSVAVVARENAAGEKLLVAYYTCPPDAAAGDIRDAADVTAALREAAARNLPAHMAPAAFVRMASLPLTANGKLDRKALPAPDAGALRTHDPVGPIGETEHTVASIWAELLGVERVGRNDNFFELGGHSLLAVRLVERMRRAGLNADVQTLFAMPTVAAVARTATKATSAAAPPNLIPHGARSLTPDMLTLVDLSKGEIESIVAGVPGGASNVQDIYPLAALQEGVLYHHLASDRGDAYLLRSRLSFDSRSSLDRFIAALQACVARHDVLRTAIAWEGLREPVQVVLRAAELPVREAPIDPNLGDAYSQLSQRFDPRRYRLDIRRAPLMEAHVAYDAANSRWLLALLFHHIVLDHTGVDVLLQDVQAHLLGQWHALPAPASFRAYIAQARGALVEREHESFFTHMLADVDEPTLPYGLVDVREGGDTIAQARYELDAALSHRLRALSKGMGVSAASLFHLAWAHVLGKLSGREDVVFGTVLLGRWQAAEGAERALGLFINTLPIRVRVGAVGSRDALLETHGALSGLLGHEHAPLALAQRCSGIAAPTPLFSALLNFRHSARRPAGAPDDTDGWKGIELLDGEERTNYPCALSVDDLGDGFSLTAQIDDRFDAARVCEYVHQALRSLADALEHAPDTPVHRLPMLALEERRLLLETWNHTDRSFPREATVPALFEAHALRSPDAPAVVERGTTITYAQLNASANAVARRLLRAGVQRGERIGVLLDRSAALIVAELAILKCGGTYVPLDSNAPAQRQAYMLNDSGALRLVTTSRFAPPPGIELERFDIDTSSIDEGGSIAEDELASERAMQGDATVPAYVMYTSGSTGQPKGVVIRHRGISRLALNNGYADFAPGERIAFTSNPAFDASTLEVWGALLNGACVVVIPHDVLLSGVDLASMLQAERVNVLHLVTGLLSAYVDALAPVFGGLRYLLTGGDSADIQAIRRIVRRSPPQHFIHCYGPTESTTFSTTYELDAWDPADSVLPIGRPISNTRIYLLDPAGHPTPVGVPGEIHVGGEGVAAGYLNLDALTSERFVPDPFSDAPDARMYRTGDLGRYRPDGNIEFLGRTDAQVKIRGFRVEPGEIEAKLAECGLIDAVVLARDDAAGDKRLIAYYTGQRHDPEALRARLRAALPEYMVPSAFIVLERMPLTPNGKLDRRALPAPDLTGYDQATYVEPIGDVEQSLARIWAQLLRVPRVGRHDNFFALGGHSLLAVRAIARLRPMFGDSATLRALFESKDLAALAERLSTGDAAPAEEEAAFATIAREDRANPLPLSFVQERLWLIAQRDGGRAYNMHGALRVDGTLSLPALQAAFDSLVARHEPLRTRFDIAPGDDVPSQFVDLDATADFAVIDVVPGELEAMLNRVSDIVFDLSRGPLLRVRVLRTAPTQHVISLVMHHIVSDGWSMSVLLADLRALYAAHASGAGVESALPALTVQYADHAAWQRRRNLQSEIAYWQRALSGYSEPIDLCVGDMPAGTGHGALGVVRRAVPHALGRTIATLSRARGASVFTVFLVGLAILCRRQTGRDDLCIGTTTAGRDAPCLEPLIGFFVNILPLRIDLSGDPTAAALIDLARDVVLDALEHQALPFERMLALVPELRQTDGRSPVPVMLRHQNVPPVDTRPWDDTLTIELMPERIERVAQSALDVELFGDDGDLEVVANFDRSMFASGHIESILDVWFEILGRMAQHPDARLSALSAMTQSERAFIDRARGARREYEDTSIVECFARQVARQPDALACVFEQRRVSYAELDSRANGIARMLQGRGVEPSMRVAIHYPRSIECLATVLACLKLNCPYVPVDPSYPATYVMRTLRDAQPAIVVTTRELAGAPHMEDEKLVLLDVEPVDAPGPHIPPFIPRKTRPDDVAYIAYTSGSTGEPKGVVVEHRQLLNCLQALWERAPFDHSEVVAQKTSMSFVPSIKEMLSGLLVGAPQVIFADPVVKDASAFAGALHAHAITRVNLVPSHLAVLLDFADQLTSLRHVTTAGEPLSRRLRERFAAALPNARLHNNYGCTELNDIGYASGDDLAGESAIVPAGRPIANCSVHLLDDALNPVPVGAIGKIFVEGPSVGPGYWNRPDLTAERFVQRPDGARMLRTGDLGRWLPDGRLLHLGREDFQIKVRGQRVELTAVEQALTAHPDVATGAAVGRTNDESEQLIAFYVVRHGARLGANALHAWLEARLPAHMVPSRFIALEALPRLPNGKLNRLALAAMDIGNVQSPLDTDAEEAPQGVLEETIAHVWREALNIDRLGRHDNFFALGGDSLSAARVAARVSNVLDARLTVRNIFDTRSVHALAAHIQAEQARANAGAPSGNEGGASNSECVAFNASGTQSPLFLAHTLQGYSWYFGHLAAHIDPDIPVYGLPPTRLGIAPPRTLEAIAARFVAMMKQIQPTGRYRIAGWSFGGLIAYEIATQLIRGGDEVEFLGLFDTTLPARPAHLDAHRAAVLALYSFALNNFTEFEPTSIDFEGASRVDALIETMVESIEARRMARVPLWHLAYDTADENRAFLHRLVAHGLAMNAWTPTPIDVRTHVFAARDTSITPLEGHAALPERLGWTAVLDPSNIEVITVPGNHETIVKFHADVLGRYIGETLTAGSIVQ